MKLTRTQVLKLLLFPVGFALLWFGLQAFLLHGLRHYSTGRLGVWNRVVRGQVNASVLLAGSSRTWVHFDPVAIEGHACRPTFNIGRDGTLPDLQLAFLKMYLRHNRRPDYLVQGLDIGIFNRSTGVYNPAQYVAFLNERELAGPLAAVDPTFRLYRFLPLTGVLATRASLTALRGALGKCLPEDHVRGYSPQRVPWRKDFEEFKRQHPNGVATSIDPRGVEAVRSILTLCREREINVILVYSPEYAENQALTVNRNELFAEFKKLSDEFGVPFWDYSDHPVCSDRRYFYNSQHLNAEGARQFSEDFGKRLAAYIEGGGAVK